MANEENKVGNDPNPELNKDLTKEQNNKNCPCQEIFEIKTHNDAERQYRVEIQKKVEKYGLDEIGRFSMYRDKFNVTKKVSRTDMLDLSKHVAVIERYINEINAMPENCMFITEFGRHLNDCLILNMFSDWILPNSVRLNLADLRCVDVLVRPESKGWFITYTDGTSETITYNRVLLAFMEINRIYKKASNEDLVSVGSLVRDVTFSDILSISSIDAMVKYENNPFIPVPIKSECKVFFTNSYFNATEDLVINDWFVNLQL